MYLLEERKAAVEDRLKLTNNKLDSTNTCLETVDGRRIDMVTKSELSGDKIDELERDLSQAKSTAQEADKRCEDVVRKLTLMEHTRDRAEEKASRAEEKVKA